MIEIESYIFWLSLNYLTLFIIIISFVFLYVYLWCCKINIFFVKYIRIVFEKLFNIIQLS
jgi:hypothetical protein